LPTPNGCPITIAIVPLQQRADEARDVFGRIDIVAVHPHDDVARRGANSDVERRRHDALGIVEQADPRILRRIAADHLAGAVIAHAVDDEDLELLRRVCRREDRIQTGRDARRFVAARQNHRHALLRRGELSSHGWLASSAARSAAES
jgi:hypothetical protein